MSNANAEAKKKLSVHFPPPAVLIAVHRGDPSAGHLLVEEISAFAQVKPTAKLVSFYRQRIQKWVQFWGYDNFLDLIIASADDGPIPDDYPTDFV